MNAASRTYMFRNFVRRFSTDPHFLLRTKTGDVIAFMYLGVRLLEMIFLDLTLYNVTTGQGGGGIALLVPVFPKVVTFFSGK